MKMIYSPDTPLVTGDTGRSPNKKNPKICVVDGSPLAFLPEELLLKILGYVSLPDLALLVRPLGNRRLKRICEDPEICKSITVNAVWDKQTVKAVLSMAGERLEELTVAVKENEDYYFNLREALVSNPDTCHLQEHLYNRFTSNAVLSTLLSVIGEYGNKITLQKLSLKTKKNKQRSNKCPLSETLLANAFFTLRNLNKIDMLDAQFGKNCSSEWVKAIADNCVNLEHIRLPPMSKLKDELFNYFIERVQRRLRHLELNGYRLNDESYCALRFCQHLEKLLIMDVWYIGQKGMKTILELPELQQLYISNAKQLTRTDFAKALQGTVMPKMLCLEMEKMSALFDEDTLEMISISYPNLHVLLLFFQNSQGISNMGIRKFFDRCKRLAIFTMHHYIGEAPPPSINDFHRYYTFQKTEFNTCYDCTYRSEKTARVKKITSLSWPEMLWNDLVLL